MKAPGLTIDQGLFYAPRMARDLRSRGAGLLSPKLGDKLVDPVQSCFQVVVGQAKADSQMVIEPKVVARHNEHAPLAQ